MFTPLNFIFFVIFTSIISKILKIFISNNTTKSLTKDNSKIIKGVWGNLYFKGYFLNRGFSFDQFNILINDDSIFIIPRTSLSFFFKNYTLTNKISKKDRIIRFDSIFLNEDNKLIIKCSPNMYPDFFAQYEEVIIKISIKNHEQKILIQEFIQNYCR